MDGQQFSEHLLNNSQEAEDFINKDAPPEIMGVIARDFFLQRASRTRDLLTARLNNGTR